MKIWYNNVVDTERQVFDSGDRQRVRIGSRPGNDIVLNSPYVAEEAAVLYKRGAAWEMVALGLNAIKIDGEDFYNGDRKLIETNEEIKLFPFSITLDLPKKKDATEAELRRQLDRKVSELIEDIHLELLERIDLEIQATDYSGRDKEYVLELERCIEKIASDRDLMDKSKGSRLLTNHIAGLCVKTQILSELTSGGADSRSELQARDTSWHHLVSAVPEREEELEKCCAYVSSDLAISDDMKLTEAIETVDKKYWSAWRKLSKQIHSDLSIYLAFRYLKKEIKDIVFGYGPLEDLIRLPTISEIMVVDSANIFVEQGGVLENSGRRFISDSVTLAIIERIVAKVGRRIDKSQPLVDARLLDGSRVNAVIPPLAVSGPCLTIRKFPEDRLLIDDLVKYGSLSKPAAEFLRAAVLNRANIIISGGTGSGKTTLLNCVSDFIPDKERIVTVEDTAELRINKQHVVQLETKSANIEGTGEYTIKDLVKNALRMRPDRIVVGECRSGEALDMLQAMNTGHDGSLTTIHANNSRDVVLRLEVLVQMASDLPISSIHRQIVSAVDLIVQLHRLRDGRRAVSQITEVVEYDDDKKEVKMRDLFVLDHSLAKAELRPTGVLPTFMDSLIQKGFLSLDSFYL